MFEKKIYVKDFKEADDFRARLEANNIIYERGQDAPIGLYVVWFKLKGNSVKS